MPATQPSALSKQVLPCFQFKASFSPCTIFQLRQYDLALLTQQLTSTTNRAPHFFQHTPVIIDLEKLPDASINFTELKNILLQHELVPMGIRNGTPAQIKAAAEVHLPPVQIGKTILNNAKPKKIETPQTKFINQPIRSGMQVYAKECDLIVTAAVSPGAELLADGHIHIYGPLRGRAMAGVQGNQQAKIFCRKLDAELISIAGYYLTREEIQAFPTDGTMLQIYLEDEHIKIMAL